MQVQAINNRGKYNYQQNKPSFRATNKINNPKSAKQEQIIMNNMYKELETAVAKQHKRFMNFDNIVSIIMAVLCVAGVVLGWSLLSKNSNDNNTKSAQIENVQNK